MALAAIDGEGTVLAPGDVEMVGSVAWAGPPADRARVVEELYDELAAKACRQRRQRERMSPALASVSGPGSAKWNREQLYLDKSLRERAQAASRAFATSLESVGDPEKLRERVALQHFVDVDLEDLSLPRAARRSEDEFAGGSGPEADCCVQMLLDATRAIFNVSGERFNFSAELESQGLDLEEQPDEVERQKAAFTARLASAVRACLVAQGDEEPHASLLRAVTATMSQSGVANVERALGGPEVVVSGGDQEILLDLSRSGECSWDLVLSVQKTGFSFAMVFPQASDLDDQDQDPRTLNCGPGSCIRRAATLRFHSRVPAASAHAPAPDLDEAGGSGAQEVTRVVARRVRAEVIDLVAELLLLDGRGRPLQLPTAPPPAEGLAVGKEGGDPGLRACLRQRLGGFMHAGVRLAQRARVSSFAGAGACCTAACGAAVAVVGRVAGRASARLPSWGPLAIVRPLCSWRALVDRGQMETVEDSLAERGGQLLLAS